ncbi:pca operon transcription factor PcaQ [Pokkaliibacter sp. MBI-7]|uniref:pca operon transcription factor PcaQ n=1 Tax=Pokkaliibacter sp. MBI-7 TaxID=3040600 RepID=UPI002446DFC9|nr:pca operon transcription factor PcaQ [Pokkaliibacter sp. MBI-7]MDH2433578.1 pca operon transcription factor PcaQ [Pokkaliibacter sp. MBI-7]
MSALDNRIKFRHLQCFLEVARQGSVGKAAQVLALTQPAVSKKLAELEDMLGVQLFERSKKGVSLTAFGEVFLRHAGASVAALREGVDSILQARRGDTLLRIGALPTVSARIMPDTVRKFKASGADATVSVQTGPNALLLEQLRLGELDVVVGRLAAPEQMTGLSFSHLYSERVALVTRPGHPLQQDHITRLDRIQDFTVLLPSDDSIIRSTVDKLLITHGIGHLPDRIETISTEFGRDYVRHSDAIWIISHGVVAKDIEEGILIELDMDTRDTMGPVGITTRTDLQASASLEMLIDCIRQVAEGIQA